MNDPVATLCAPLTETRRFTMHPKLLFDVIQRQAGTLSKAVLEAVMNSIDAGATKCEITLTNGRVTVVDDGKGFRNREEIESFFEVFGQPHAESEGKRYGTFRMGRGQCFSFGRNLWRTGTFRMDVDIKNKGLEYELLSSESPQPGCMIDIEFYEVLRPTAVIDMTRDFERLVRYAPIPVILNGKNLSEPASDTKWPIETDEAYMKIDVGGTNGLKVYNLGVHVADLYSYTWGCSGTIVSKQQLKVNFARNDIMADDPVWKKIAALIRKQVAAGSGKKKISPSERSALFRRILSGEVHWQDYSDTKFFTDCTGRGWSVSQMESRGEAFGSQRYDGAGRFSFAPRNSFDGDRIMQHGLGLVLDEEMLDIVGVKKPDDFFKIALPGYGKKREIWQGKGLLAHAYMPLEKLGADLKNDRHIMLPAKEWKVREQIILRHLDNYAGSIIAALSKLGVETERRRLVVGVSEHALGWTDGSSYIALSRRSLSEVRPGAEGFMAITGLLLHEYCHVESDIGDHIHDTDFYKLFHDASDVIGKVAGGAAAGYSRHLRKESVKMPIALQRSAALHAEADSLDAAFEVWSDHREAKRFKTVADCRAAMEPATPPIEKTGR